MQTLSRVCQGPSSPFSASLLPLQQVGSTVATSVYTFGPFRLEAHERRLVRDGSLVPLSGKAFDTLLLLVEGAGTLQHQQALMDRLWPDTFVEPNNLQHNVSLVR